jgi:hypothetical protein
MDGTRLDGEPERIMPELLHHVRGAPPAVVAR